jgi:AraC family transcriptional regulator of adaptative response/methylated-DNA-[protein]-cysteine methyltransferase
MQTLPPIANLDRARRRKDPAYEGLFVFAVKTTGVFCRPTCRAKPAKLKNVEFFATPQQALRSGYRPCKLCDPLDPAPPPPPPMVRRLLELVGRDDSNPLRERDLRTMGIDPSTARRQFRHHFDLTFAAYQRARRLSRAACELRNGNTVALAQAGAGFESSSGFRAALARTFGTAKLTRNDVTLLTSTRIATPLGAMFAIAGDAGIVLCDFADRDGLNDDVRRLRERCGAPGAPAAIVPGSHPHLTMLATELEEYFAGSRRSFGVPLAPHGTPFQKRAWELLRTIPYGQTRTYARQARAVGASRAVRAVARANAANLLCILIPCHRVIGTNGKLTGYAGGLGRKRWLLQHEKRFAP